MRHGPRILPHEVFLNTNITFTSSLTKADGTVIIDPADITEVELKAWAENDDISSATALLTSNKTTNPTYFVVDIPNKKIIFDVPVDSLPIGKYQYTITVTKTSWTEPKAIYAGYITKHSRVQ